MWPFIPPNQRVQPVAGALLAPRPAAGAVPLGREQLDSRHCCVVCSGSCWSAALWHAVRSRDNAPGERLGCWRRCRVMSACAARVRAVVDLGLLIEHDTFFQSLLVPRPVFPFPSVLLGLLIRWLEQVRWRCAFGFARDWSRSALTAVDLVWVLLSLAGLRPK